MKIGIYSDLHFEFKHFTFPKSIKDLDVLIFAGDIGPWPYAEKAFKQIPKHVSVLYVPGNHEYYNKEIHSTDEAIQNFCDNANNLYYLNPGIKFINNQKFVGACWWTDFRGRDWHAMHAAEENMNDYHKIRKHNKKLRARDTALINQQHTDFLLDNISEGCIVVTHHAPSTKSLNNSRAGGLLNAAYANDFDYVLMQENTPQPALWVHGHTHIFADYEIGRTRIISNAKGYFNQNADFQPNFMLEI